MRYRRKEQKAMVIRVFEEAIERMQSFADLGSRCPEDLPGSCDRDWTTVLGLRARAVF